MIWRTIKALAFVLAGWLAITGIPFVARYLRMREM